MRASAGLLDGQDGIRHGFFGRQGGVSTGPYASLNMALRTGDERAHVLENRRICAQSLDAAALVVARQVHSPDVVTVTTPWQPDDAPEADALVTTVPGLLIGVTSADCAPILFCDVEARVVGAAHAGWKGALGGVVAATVETMVAAGASVERIAAVVGPCIQRRSYEVGPEFEQRFHVDDPDSAPFFTSGRAGKWHFDLEGYVCLRLRRAGVQLVQATGVDTVGDPERWFSYRRTTLAGGGPFGTQLSAIMLA